MLTQATADTSHTVRSLRRQPDNKDVSWAGRTDSAIDAVEAKLDAPACNWFDAPIPAWIEDAIVGLYANTFATVEFQSIADPAATQNACVLTIGGTCREVLLFALNARKLKVHSTVQRYRPENLQLFIAEAFKKFPGVSAIEFEPMIADSAALKPTLRRAGHRVHAATLLEDVVAELPATDRDYRMSLAKSTRRSLKRSIFRLERQHPDYTIEVVERSAISDKLLDDIFSLHYSRMLLKGMKSGMIDGYRSRVVRMLKRRGLVGVIRIDGKVAAGSVGYAIGDQVYSELIAHDPEHDALYPGILCTYFTMREAISRGYRHWHFLWGNSDYKYRMGGIRKDLATIVVYRSLADFLLDTPARLARLFRAGLRSLKLRLSGIAKRSHHMQFARAVKAGMTGRK